MEHEISRLMPLLMIFIPVVLLGIVGTMLARRERAARQTWTLFAEGVFEQARYKEKTFSRRRGAMVHRTEYYTVRYWTIVFDKAVLYDLVFDSVPKFPKRLAHIKIFRNGLGRYKVE